MKLLRVKSYLRVIISKGNIKRYQLKYLQVNAILSKLKIVVMDSYSIYIYILRKLRNIY